MSGSSTRKKKATKTRKKSTRARSRKPKSPPPTETTTTEAPSQEVTTTEVEPELEAVPVPDTVLDMQAGILGEPSTARSAYVRLGILITSFALAFYLVLESATILAGTSLQLPISSLLINDAHLSGTAAAYGLVAIAFGEVIVVQIWAWRTRRLSAGFESDELSLEAKGDEYPQMPTTPLPGVQAEQAQQETVERLDSPPTYASVEAAMGTPPAGEPVELVSMEPPVEPAIPTMAAETVTEPPPRQVQEPVAVVQEEPEPEKPAPQVEVEVPQPRLEIPQVRKEEQTTVLSQVQETLPEVVRPRSPVPARAPGVPATRAPEQVAQPAQQFVMKYRIYPDNPDVYVGIQRDAETGGFRYVVVEPRLNPAEKQVYTNLTRLLVDELEVDMAKLKNNKKATDYLTNEAKNIATKYNLKIGPESYRKIAYYFTRDYIHLGKIEVLMNDARIEDISCDGPKVPLFIWHRDYESIPTSVIFNDEKELDQFASKLAYVSGKHISIASPIVDATLPDGSRVQITYGREVSKRGGNFTIRKFKADPITIVDLLKYNTCSPELGAYLWYLIEKRMSMLVAGGTASGKTTTLNALSMFIPPDQKIVSVEDTPELNLSHKNWIQSISRGGGVAGEITLFDLLKSALRQRPDIIIVGEVRGVEAFTLFQAIATGHGGLGTIHADSVQAAINRITSEPMNVPKSLLGSTLDCLVMQLRIKLKDKSVRRMVHVAEIVGHETSTDQIVLNNAFKWDPVTDSYIFSGRSRLFEKITKRYGTTPEQIRGEIEDRRIFLTWMMKKNIRDYKDLSQKIREFYSDQRTSIDMAMRGLEGT